jgi:hypothetical protein
MNVMLLTYRIKVKKNEVGIEEFLANLSSDPRMDPL